MAVATIEGARAPTIDIDVFGEEFLANPYGYHAQVRDAGPVFYLRKYGIYGMARHAEVSAALKDWQTFISSREWVSATSRPRSHGDRRRCCWKPIPRCMIGRAG